jgi:hypothetical protein
MRHDAVRITVVDSIAPLRDFVRHRLDYITFRPWRNLNLLSVTGDWVTMDTLEWGVRCDPRFGGKRDASYIVDWEIVWHVGDQAPAPTPHEDGYAINDSLLRILGEYEAGHFGRGELSFDFIVRRSTEVSSKKASLTMAIEMYVVPGYILHTPPFARPQTVVDDTRERVARRAYLRNEPLPPLIPGSLTFAS